MRRLLGLALSALSVISSTSMVVPAQSNKVAQRIAKVKRTVNEIGFDEKVNVKLMDGSKVKGRISEIGDDFFVLVESKTADSRRLTFAQVSQIGRVIDNPFSDPKTILGLALIPTIIGFCFWARNKD